MQPEHKRASNLMLENNNFIKKFTDFGEQQPTNYNLPRSTGVSTRGPAQYVKPTITKQTSSSSNKMPGSDTNTGSPLINGAQVKMNSTSLAPAQIPQMRSKVNPNLVRNNLGFIPIKPIVEKAKVSQKIQSPNMVAYGANTHNGLIRNYNEDRISIVLDLKKPGIQPTSTKQPSFKIQFFAIFDGHGGQGCAEFLRDNLHNMIAS